MSRSTQTLPIALTLIIVGTLLLLSELRILTLVITWPMLLIAIGILLLLKFLLKPTEYRLLLPTAVLLILGTLFLYLENTSYQRLTYLWPTFILAPGVGFLFLFFFGPSGNRFWQPALILMAVAGLFYWGFWRFWHYWPVILIIIGLILLLDVWQAKQSIDKQQE